MAKADSLKEELGWLRLVFAASLAVDALTVIWLLYNYRIADIIILTSGFFVVVVITCLLVWIIHHAFELLGQLEDA